MQKNNNFNRNRQELSNSCLTPLELSSAPPQKFLSDIEQLKTEQKSHCILARQVSLQPYITYHRIDQRTTENSNTSTHLTGSIKIESRGQLIKHVFKKKKKQLCFYIIFSFLLAITNSDKPKYTGASQTCDFPSQFFSNSQIVICWYHFPCRWSTSSSSCQIHDP